MPRVTQPATVTRARGGTTGQPSVNPSALAAGARQVSQLGSSLTQLGQEVKTLQREIDLRAAKTQLGELTAGMETKAMQSGELATAPDRFQAEIAQAIEQVAGNLPDEYTRQQFSLYANFSAASRRAALRRQTVSLLRGQANEAMRANIVEATKLASASRPGSPRRAEALAILQSSLDFMERHQLISPEGRKALVSRFERDVRRGEVLNLLAGGQLEEANALLSQRIKEGSLDPATEVTLKNALKTAYSSSISRYLQSLNIQQKLLDLKQQETARNLFAQLASDPTSVDENTIFALGASGDLDPGLVGSFRGIVRQETEPYATDDVGYLQDLYSALDGEDVTYKAVKGRADRRYNTTQAEKLLRLSAEVQRDKGGLMQRPDVQDAIKLIDATLGTGQRGIAGNLLDPGDAARVREAIIRFRANITRQWQQNPDSVNVDAAINETLAAAKIPELTVKTIYADFSRVYPRPTTWEGTWDAQGINAGTVKSNIERAATLRESGKISRVQYLEAARTLNRLGALLHLGRTGEQK